MLALAVDDRCPAALEERPARPQHDRRRADQPDPVRQPHVEASAEPHAEHHVAHRQQEHRQTQRAPIHSRRVMSTSSGFGGRRRDGARLERHAADRTGSRRVADDLRVHRTGVFRPRLAGRSRGPARAPCRTSGRRRDNPARTSGSIGQKYSVPGERRLLGGVRHPASPACEKCLRVRLEPLEARMAAEVVASAVVVVAAGGSLRRDGHAANRVDGRRAGCAGRADDRRGTGVTDRSLLSYASSFFVSSQCRRTCARSSSIGHSGRWSPWQCRPRCSSVRLMPCISAIFRSSSADVRLRDATDVGTGAPAVLPQLPAAAGRPP